MSAAPWWVGMPAATTTVACGPNEHRLVWDAGRLTPVDHADPAVEAVLAELGGEEPACLAVRRHWDAHAADGRVLTLAGRHPGDTLGLTGVELDRVRGLVDQDNARRRTLIRGGGSGGPGGRGSGPQAQRIEANLRHLGLLELLALDPAVVRRLQSQVAAALAAEPSTGPGQAVLEAGTVGRLGPLAGRWSGGRDVTVRLGVDPSVTAEPVVTVRPDWLATVWGRYLGVVDGFLVLEVHRIVDGRAEVSGVGAPGGDPARLTLRGPAPWRVERRRPG